MTPRVSTVNYTKNANLNVKQTVKQIVRIDIIRLLNTLCLI